MLTNLDDNGRFPSIGDKVKGIVNGFVTVLRCCNFADGLPDREDRKVIVAENADDGQVFHREEGRGA